MDFWEAIDDLIDSLREMLKSQRIAKKKEYNRITRSWDIIVYSYRKIIGIRFSKRILIRFLQRGKYILPINYYQKEHTAVRVVKDKRIREALEEWKEKYDLLIGIIGKCN